MCIRERYLRKTLSIASFTLSIVHFLHNNQIKNKFNLNDKKKILLFFTSLKFLKILIIHNSKVIVSLLTSVI